MLYDCSYMGYLGWSDPWKRVEQWLPWGLSVEEERESFSGRELVLADSNFIGWFSNNVDILNSTELPLRNDYDGKFCVFFKSTLKFFSKSVIARDKKSPLISASAAQISFQQLRISGITNDHLS